MIKLKDLEITNTSGVYLIVDKKDKNEFLLWLKENDLKEINLVKDLTYILIKDNEVSLTNRETLKDNYYYYFSNVKEGRLLPVIHGCMLLKEKVEIPEGDTYLPYGLKGIVMPLLDNPKDINKLFKNYNKGKPWATPIIYYKGYFNDKKELIKHFGINDLNSKDHKAQVISYGDDVLDNVSNCGIAGNYLNPRRWILDDNELPRILKKEELMNSILIPNKIESIAIRCLNPTLQINENILIDGEVYKQVFVHCKDVANKLLAFLKKNKVKEVYYIKQNEKLHNEDLYLINTASLETKLLGKKETLNIDSSNKREVGHFMFMVLGAYKNKHKEMFEFEINKNFNFPI